jgi:anti-sigma factor RsiW
VTTTENDRLLLNAYVDGELDPAHALEFEQRLAGDDTLAGERRRIEALRNAMRERLPRETASPALRRRVAALARPQPFAINWRAGWAAMTASAAAAFAAGCIATFVALGLPGREPIPELLVASHMWCRQTATPSSRGSTASCRSRPAWSISRRKDSRWWEGGSTSSA